MHQFVPTLKYRTVAGVDDSRRYRGILAADAHRYPPSQPRDVVLADVVEKLTGALGDLRLGRP